MEEETGIRKQETDHCKYKYIMLSNGVKVSYMKINLHLSCYRVQRAVSLYYKWLFYTDFTYFEVFTILR